MDGWIDGWMYGWMGGWMDGWMDGWTDRRMDGWMDGWMDDGRLVDDAWWMMDGGRWMSCGQEEADGGCPMAWGNGLDTV